MADDVAGEDSVTWVYATKEYTLKVSARVVVEKESGTEEDGAVLKGVGKRRHLLVLVDDEGEAREVHKAFVRPADIDRLRPLPPDAKAHCDVCGMDTPFRFQPGQRTVPCGNCSAADIVLQKCGAHKCATVGDDGAYKWGPLSTGPGYKCKGCQETCMHHLCSQQGLLCAKCEAASQQTPSEGAPSEGTAADGAQVADSSEKAALTGQRTAPMQPGSAASTGQPAAPASAHAETARAGHRYLGRKCVRLLYMRPRGTASQRWVF